MNKAQRQTVRLVREAIIEALDRARGDAADAIEDTSAAGLDTSKVNVAALVRHREVKAAVRDLVSSVVGDFQYKESLSGDR